jgi:hypothetical protein
MLYLCPVTNIMLAESRKDDLLFLSASHNRVMPDVRFDGACSMPHYIKIKGAKTMQS